MIYSFPGIDLFEYSKKIARQLLEEIKDTNLGVVLSKDKKAVSHLAIFVLLNMGYIQQEIETLTGVDRTTVSFIKKKFLGYTIYSGFMILINNLKEKIHGVPFGDRNKQLILEFIKS